MFILRTLMQAALLKLGKNNKNVRERVVINLRLATEHRKFWNSAVKEDYLFPLWEHRRKIVIPPQIGDNDCGIFPIGYAEVIPSLSNPLSVDEWTKIRPPSMADIPGMRANYTREYMKLVSRKTTKGYYSSMIIILSLYYL